MFKMFIQARIQEIVAKNHDEFENPIVFQHDGASPHFLRM